MSFAFLKLRIRRLARDSGLLLSQLFLCGALSAEPIQKVDIFLLFDDTGSFAAFAPTVRDIFSDLVDEVEDGLPGVEFGFGVGRFEDYGGDGWDFCSNHSEVCADDFVRRVSGRPFILNQPIIVEAAVGGRAERDALILESLSREAPGAGGDDPESHLEALWQIATGAGFDGNSDAVVNGLDGSQNAGSSGTQIFPDESGDVPAFSSLDPGVPSSGTLGGVGFRSDALKIVIIATEICSSIPFRSDSAIPSSIVGRYSTEAVADFACLSTIPGDDRFGLISNSSSFANNSVPNAVAPKGAASLPDTIEALNASDIRVLAMGPGLSPKAPGSGPAHEPSGFLSALARITGGVDTDGSPLIFDTGNGGQPLRDRIVQAILAAAIESPGCSQQDLTALFTSVDQGIQKQRRLAKKLARIVQADTKLKRNLKRFRNWYSKSIAITQSFPKQVTVCANEACPMNDRSNEINALATFSKKFSRSINTSLKNIPSRSLARRLRKKAETIQLQNTADVSQIPASTHLCP